MDRKSYAAVFVNVIFNGVVVPKALDSLDTPTPVIVAVSLMSIALVLVWGHAQRGVTWRKRVLPITLMAIGLACLVTGAIWFYRQQPAPKPTRIAVAPVTAAPSSPPHPTPIPSSSPSPTSTYNIEAVTRGLNRIMDAHQRDLQRREAELAGPSLLSPSGTPTFAQTIKNDLAVKQALILGIASDWRNSNDGVPSTDAEILDKATPYINDQLRLRGQKWKFDRDMRKRLGFPPAIGDSYEPD